VCHVALTGSKDALKNRISLMEKKRDMDNVRDIDLKDSENHSDDSDADSDCGESSTAGEKIFSVQTGESLCADFGSHCGYVKPQVMLSKYSDLDNYVKMRASSLSPKVEKEFGDLQRCGVIKTCHSLFDPAFTFIEHTCPDITRASIFFHQMLTGKVKVFFSGDLVEYAMYRAKIANEDVIYFSFYFWRKYVIDSSQASQKLRLNDVANFNHSHCIDFFKKYKLFSFLVSFPLHICYALIRTCLYCINVLLFFRFKKALIFQWWYARGKNPAAQRPYNFITLTA
jgi:hypothetical protein